MGLPILVSILLFTVIALSVEVHIFDFDEKLYGLEIEIEFIQRIRSEIEFESADKLVMQIKKDISAAKNILD